MPHFQTVSLSKDHIIATMLDWRPSEGHWYQEDEQEGFVHESHVDHVAMSREFNDIITLPHHPPKHKQDADLSTERPRNTSQNLGNPQIWAENFAKMQGAMYHKFQDPHFSSVTASLKSGIMILVMHS